MSTSTDTSTLCKDTFDVSALLNQYIAEATEGETISENANTSTFDFVDLDDLVKTTYDATESNGFNIKEYVYASNLSAQTQIQVLDDPLMLENIKPSTTNRSLPIVAPNAEHEKNTVEKTEKSKTKITRYQNEQYAKKLQTLNITMKPKRVRESRARPFLVEEIYCFLCKTKFKRPQSLKAHLLHRHGKLGQPKITLRI